MEYFGSEWCYGNHSTLSDEEENTISSPPLQWWDGNHSTLSDEEENAISSLLRRWGDGNHSTLSDEEKNATSSPPLEWWYGNHSTLSDEEENAISSPPLQWWDGNQSTLSDEEENAISSPPLQWWDGNQSTLSDEEENAISSPPLQWWDGNQSTLSDGEQNATSSPPLQWWYGDHSTSSDEEENEISSPNSYNLNTGKGSEYAPRDDILASPHQWRDGNHSTLSHLMECLAISVPNLRDSSSLAHTSVNDKVKRSAIFIKENTPQDVCRRESIGIGSSSGGKGEEKRREEVPVKINCKVVAPEGRWIKHYSSCHRILLVGEGDFSFSTCLAEAFGSASNMVATSLDSQAFLVKNYQKALSNLVELGMRKCKVMHEIDATEMANHAFLGEIKFDRIIFNFPFAGFFKEMPRNYQLGLHRRLVYLFLKNAKEMISENGEIHITHKTNGFHREWNLESLASSQGLRLVEAVDFNLVDYPGYNTKCGFGGDNNFNCSPSMTYKFGL